MNNFRYHRDAVYIFENVRACRVKVGMTCGDVYLRLSDVGRKWSGRKPTCQICGSRRISGRDGLFPEHVVSGRSCLGGHKLPLEKDVSVAESYLQSLMQTLPELSGSEKRSAARQIKTLEKRIEQFRNYKQPEGMWHFGVAYYTDSAGEVESLSHEVLSEHLDAHAPLGEVFCCSLPEAVAAVESVLSKLNLLGAVTKETRDDTASTEYGECIICGGQVTKRGSCPECANRVRNA